METERLKLRQWIASDKQPFYELNSDLEVMKYFHKTLSKKESDLFIKIMKSKIAKNNWGFWAVELKSSNDFIGFVGLNSPAVKLPFSPCVEIGWRLSKKYWGNGYATEAAQVSLRYAFEQLSLDEVVSFTSVINSPSRAVMKRINMSNVSQNFDHPSVPKENKLKEHVLYKITKKAWEQSF